MPRNARKKSESGVYHIILRGINKQSIFENDEDRERFLETIKRYKTKSKYEIYGYCLMDNHVHMILKETEETISVALKRICSSYVYWYNWKYQRCGHLFQERYKSEAIENEAYLLTVLRYIHQNPVKAGLAKNMEEYKWSSYCEYIKSPDATDTEFILQIISANREKAIDMLIKYTNEKNEDKCLDYEEKIRITDNEAKEYLARLGYKNTSELQQLDKDKRNEIIRGMKSIQGITVRQLSRIIGVSKSVINRV